MTEPQHEQFQPPAVQSGQESSESITPQANAAAKGQYHVTFLSGASIEKDSGFEIAPHIQTHIKALSGLNAENLMRIELAQTTSSRADVLVVFDGLLNPAQTDYLKDLGKTPKPSTEASRDDEKRRAWTSVYQNGPPSTEIQSNGPSFGYNYTD